MLGVLLIIPKLLAVKWKDGSYLFIYCLKQLRYWSIIALQCCVSFCCIMKWISCMYTHMNQLYVYTYESAVCIHISPASHCPPPQLTPLGHARALSSQLPLLCSSFPLAVYYTHESVYTSVLLFNSSLPLLHPLCSRVLSLHLRPCSCPANKFTCSIFLESIYICSCMIFVFLFLTYFTPWDSRSIHITTHDPISFKRMVLR